MDNPFRVRSKEEIKRAEQEAQELTKKINKVAEDARACLNSGVFAKYRDSVKEAREGLIRLMKMNSDPDPVKFAFFCKACLSKIDAFDMMIEEINKDAKKEISR